MRCPFLPQFLNALYCKGIGVSDESIFGFSVQTFTTPSLVRLLADASAETPSALLPNPDNGAWPLFVRTGPPILYPEVPLAFAMLLVECDRASRLHT